MAGHKDVLSPVRVTLWTAPTNAVEQTQRNLRVVPKPHETGQNFD